MYFNSEDLRLYITNLKAKVMKYCKIMMIWYIWCIWYIWYNWCIWCIWYIVIEMDYYSLLFAKGQQSTREKVEHKMRSFAFIFLILPRHRYKNPGGTCAKKFPQKMEIKHSIHDPNLWKSQKASNFKKLHISTIWVNRFFNIFL